MKKSNLIMFGMMMGGLALNANAATFGAAGSISIDAGGDELVAINSVSTGQQIDSITAGGGIRLMAGVNISDIGHELLEVEATIGLKSDKQDVVGGSVEFERYPIDVLAFASMGNFRVGGGISYHMAPTLTFETSFGDFEAEFDNALGYVVQADVFNSAWSDNAFASQTYIGLRYQSIEYKLSDSSETFDGSNVGLVLGLSF